MAEVFEAAAKIADMHRTNGFRSYGTVGKYDEAAIEIAAAIRAAAPPDMGVTGNVQLLLGWLWGALGVARSKSDFYNIKDIDPGTGTMIIEHDNGNQYRVAVTQISGVE